MTHSEAELQMDAYVDGELALRDARDLETHLEGCRDCTRLYDARVALGAAIRAEVPAFRAPEKLRTQVRAALSSAARNSATRRIIAPLGGRWLAVAASLALVVVGTWRLASNRAAAEALADQVLTSHVRSLMPGHLTDVVSSDQHTVKPWFNGKLDFSPPVYDFAGRGYPLIGGRLDYLGGRPVAALVYGRRQHLINVFLWPVAQQQPADGHTATRQGYHLLHWKTGDYVYWVASDLGTTELDEFAELLLQADSTAAR